MSVVHASITAYHFISVVNDLGTSCGRLKAPEIMRQKTQAFFKSIGFLPHIVRICFKPVRFSSHTGHFHI